MNNHHTGWAYFAVGSATASWGLADVEKWASIFASLLSAIAALIVICPKVRNWWKRRRIPPGASNLIALACVFLCGCSAPGVVHRTFTPEGKLLSETRVYQSPNAKGEGYINAEWMPTGGVNTNAGTGDNYNVEGIRAAFGAFRIWHIAALLCIIVGGAILGFKQIPNRWGWTLVFTGIGLGVAAHVIPAYGSYFAAAAGIGALAGLVYLAFFFGFWKPNPNLTDEQRRAAAQRMAFS